MYDKHIPSYLRPITQSDLRGSKTATKDIKSQNFQIWVIDFLRKWPYRFILEHVDLAVKDGGLAVTQLDGRVVLLLEKDQIIRRKFSLCSQWSPSPLSLSLSLSLS